MSCVYVEEFCQKIGRRLTEERPPFGGFIVSTLDIAL